MRSPRVISKTPGSRRASHATGARARATPAAPPWTGDELFRRLADAVLDYAMIALTPEGLITYWNTGAQRMKGYAASEVMGQHFSLLYPDKAIAERWPDEELRRAAKDGRLEDEGWRRRKDGSLFWANVVITAVRDPAGKTIAFFKITRDLTERRQTEQRLQQSERNLRHLINGIKDHALFFVAPDGRIASWNPGAERLFGYDARRAIGMASELLYLETDRSHRVPTSDLGWARQEGYFESVGWRVKADGARIWTDVTITASHGQDGALHGYVEVVRDLSERQRVQELELETRNLGEFIAMLSHELRNPLASIVSATNVLRQVIPGSQALRPVDVIGRQSRLLTRLVDDLLDVNRAATGKMRVRLLPTDLKAIVLGAIEGVRGEITGNGQLLRTHFEDHPYVVAADVARLAQAVVNLLTNATRYTQAGGQIDVELAADDAFATLRVLDNGVGMSEELVQRAFDPFVQGDGSPGRSHRGLGIGLTLVRKIVTLHNGSITVESAPGRGTTFTLRLPLAHLAIAPEPAIADDAATRSPVATEEHRILIVDDNDDVAQTLASALSLLGYQVTTAADGLQAIETALRQQPDVVLLDLGMPGMDGYEVARRLREIPELASMRVAAVTGYGQPKDRLATRELGFDEHFVKPVEAAQLASFIEGKPARE